MTMSCLQHFTTHRLRFNDGHEFRLIGTFYYIFLRFQYFGHHQIGILINISLFCHERVCRVSSQHFDFSALPPALSTLAPEQRPHVLEGEDLLLQMAAGPA